jgi:hypothetical protein
MDSMGVNIKMPLHGLTPVKGDGTDETSAIQAIIDYVANNGGGVVFAPIGTYKHTTLNLKSRVYFIGAGRGTDFVNTGDSSSFRVGDSTNYIFNTKISNLNLSGNTTYLEQHGIEFVGNNPAYCQIDKIYMFDLGGNGIYGGHHGHVNNVEISGCFIDNCTGNGIDMQYGKGQINAVWIHHNNVVNNNIGVLFFGNSVIVEDNTIQANEKYGISLSNDQLDLKADGYIDKNCYGSSITKNYFELNGETVDDASVVGIFTGYESSGTTVNKVLRSLEITNNYFGESGANYSAVIHCVDLKNSVSSNRNCVLKTNNNYCSTLPILSFNKKSALSDGSVIDESHNQAVTSTLRSALPDYVEVRGYAVSNLTESLWTRHEKILNYTAGKTYIITLYLEDNQTESTYDIGMSILNIKASGFFDYGNPAKFAYENTFYTGPMMASTIISMVNPAHTSVVPTITPISYVANYNGYKALQFTITTVNSGHMTIYFNMDIAKRSHRFLRVVIA